MGKGQKEMIVSFTGLYKCTDNYGMWNSTKLANKKKRLKNP